MLKENEELNKIKRELEKRINSLNVSATAEERKSECSVDKGSTGNENCSKFHEIDDVAAGIIS